MSQKPAPILTSAPILENMPFKATAETIKVSCVPGNYKYADIVKSEIWLRNDSNGVTSLYSIAPTVELDRLFFQKYGGSWISCKSIAKGQGGTTESLSNRFIAPFEAPIEKGKPVISGNDGINPPIENAKVSCGGWSWVNEVTSEKISWSVETKGQSIGLINLSSNSSITLDKNFLDNYSGNYLVCSVTGVNYGGSTTLSTKTFITLPPVRSQVKLPLAQNVYFRITGIEYDSLVAAGSTAYCDAPGSVNYETNFTWYMWDDSTPVRLEKVLGTSRELILTRDILVFFSKKDTSTSYLNCLATFTNATGSLKVGPSVAVRVKVPALSKL